MKKLIITADDYGVYRSIDEGIMEAVKQGKVNSVACLVNHSGSIASIKNLYNEYGDRIDIGCHLTITSGKPITDNLGDEFLYKGNFRPFGELDIDAIEAKPQELKRELTAQVQTLLDNGIPIKHLSCHHNSLTTTRPLFEVYRQVAEQFGIPMRSVNIIPTKKDSHFRLALKLMLYDNVPARKLREMRRFGKRIYSICQKEYNQLRMPGVLETRHYGPLPFVEVWEAGSARRVARKHRDISKFIKELSGFDCNVGEMVVHLINYTSYLSGVDDEISYPGINERYFDSRNLEYQSLLGYDFNKHKLAITFGRWVDL